MPHCQPGFSSFGFFKWLSFTEGYMVPFDEVLAQGSKQQIPHQQPLTRKVGDDAFPLLAAIFAKQLETVVSGACCSGGIIPDVSGPEKVCLCFLTSGPHLNLQNDHRILESEPGPV
jgi:hypothetical protein